MGASASSLGEGVAWDTEIRHGCVALQVMRLAPKGPRVTLKRRSTAP